MSVVITDSQGNSKLKFAQWESGRVLVISGVTNPVLRFFNRLVTRALPVIPTADGDNFTCEVPNIILMADGPFFVSVLEQEDDELREVLSQRYIVMPRMKPQDYEYTDNVGYVNWVQMSEQAQELLDNIPTAIEDYLSITLRGVKDLDIVESTDDLLTTGKSTVIVKADDSVFGGGGTVKFAPQTDSRVYRGYVNANGDRLYPLPAESAPPTVNPPVRQLMAVIKSWMGREDIKWGAEGTLFDETCEKIDGYFHMVCSDFVSAVLLGITYENSRYALGSEADNIQIRPYGFVDFPQSTAQHRVNGGLTTDEIALYFAEHGRLFKMPTRSNDIYQTLRFGDLLYRSDETDDTDKKAFWAIAHVSFVIGTIGNRVLVAEASTATGSNVMENSDLHIRAINIGDNNSQYLMFLRPDYKTDYEVKNDFLPTENGYTLDPIFTPCVAIQRTSGGTTPPGQPYYGPHMCSTLEFIPVVPGMKFTYDGAETGRDSARYWCALYEYDEKLKHIRNNALLSITDGPRTLTMSNNTRFIRLSFGYSASAGKNMCFNEMGNFHVTVENPQGGGSEEPVFDISARNAQTAGEVYVDTTECTSRELIEAYEAGRVLRCGYGEALLPLANVIVEEPENPGDPYTRYSFGFSGPSAWPGELGEMPHVEIWLEADATSDAAITGEVQQMTWATTGALALRYMKPSTGIPKTDLASAVQTSLGKADTALQAVPSTYRTAAAQDAIDSGKIDKPSNPATGAFLVWNGSAWAAQTLSTWQGGSY